MSLSLIAQHFKNYLQLSLLTVDVTIKTRTEGSADSSGHVPITYASPGSTVKGFVDDAQERAVNQQTEGLFIEETKLIDLSADQTVHELDKLTINGVDYEVQNVTPYASHLRIIAKRMVPV